MDDEGSTHISIGVTVISISKYLFTCFFCLFIAGNLKAQNDILDKEIELPELSMTVENFLKLLSEEGGFTFTYSNSHIPLKKEVTLSSKKQSVRKFLDEIFDETPIRYVEKNNKILLILDTDSNERPKQTIRGMVIDAETREPLIGVNIVATSEEAFFGFTTNQDGVFRFDKLPVGRYALQVSYVGYEVLILSDIMVGSGKEEVLNIELKESLFQLDAVNITSSYYRDQPLNESVVVSSRSFSAMETENYPGALTDISRAAVSFPGVVSENDGQNHIIIRGNSPKGMQWRLEGIEIPNLNHFAEIGSSGGGIGIISNNILANSEFLTGAFPAEYGNALSGIFDLNIRNGNNEKHEKTFQISMIGTEIMVEGPINKSMKSSYIAQYRYCTFQLIRKLKADIPNIPEFQDVSFKVDLPTKRAGKFSIFGIGGLSHEEGVDFDYDWRSNMGTIGFSNNYRINETTSIKSTLAFSGWKYLRNESAAIGNGDNTRDDNMESRITESTIRTSIIISRRIAQKHKLKTGLIFGNTFFNTYMRWYSDSLYNQASDPANAQDVKYDQVYSDYQGEAATGQVFFNWNYKIRKNLTSNIGIHFLQFYLNNNYSIEPRLGLSWEFFPRHSLNFGFGVHSRMESLTLYTGLGQHVIGNSNINLGFTKSNHYVLGYGYRINDDIFLKIEGYYQDLYNIPVLPHPTYFSLVNMDYGFEGNHLVNEGTAFNKGIEITLEKFFSKGYYFMLNGTLYDSKFKNYLGQEFDTKYNGSYAANAVFLKEFYVGKKKQNIIGLNSRCIFNGGLRHHPIDLQKSIANGTEYRISDQPYSYKAPDYFRIDLQFSYKRNKPKHSTEWRLDILNLTDNKNVDRIRYNNVTKSIETTYQNRLIPMLAYRVMF